MEETTILLPKDLISLIEENRGLIIAKLPDWVRSWRKSAGSEAEIIRDLSELRKDLDPKTKPLKLTPMRRIAIRNLLIAGYELQDFKDLPRSEIIHLENWYSVGFVMDDNESGIETLKSIAELMKTLKKKGTILKWFFLYEGDSMALRMKTKPKTTSKQLRNIVTKAVKKFDVEMQKNS